MKFEREQPKCSFTVPDRPTVRQQLEYLSLAGGAAGRKMLERYWEGAVALIQTWDCEIFPDWRVALDDVDNPDIVDVLVWAGLKVRNHINSLDNVPKNS